MRVTIDEAAAIYARACAAWYGATKALGMVRQQVHVMQKRGDQSGVEAWTKVALALERMQADTEAKPAEVQPYTRASRSGRAVRNRRKA